MAYQSNNYNFVIDSSFTPFTMQEMLTPFALYKDAFEKTEAAYDELSQKSDVFADLSASLPEDSTARKIYEGYAKDLKKQAEDLAKNGLSMGNRKALTSLKRRYSGEIGRLERANTALKEEKATRKAMMAKDSSMIYAIDKLNIDQFLDGNEPNLYGISGTELYTRGVAIGKAESSRIYSAGDGGDTLDGYYKKWVERQGYTAEQLNKFGREIREDFVRQVSTLPELQERANALLEEKGVFDNLPEGPARQRAVMSVINGMIDGAITAEKTTPMQNLGKLTAAQAAADKRAQEQIAVSWANHALSAQGQALTAASNGMVYDSSKKQWVYNPSRDPKQLAQEWMYTHSDENNPSPSNRTGISSAAQSIISSGGGIPGVSRSGTPKTPTITPPTGDFEIDADGKVSDIRKDGVKGNYVSSYGTPISWDTAARIQPALEREVKEEYRNSYYYYDAGNGKVRVRALNKGTQMLQIPGVESIIPQ